MALFSIQFPKEQIDKLCVLDYFLDTGDSKSPVKMLEDISGILSTQIKEKIVIKNDIHICTHHMDVYCSTGLGGTVEVCVLINDIHKGMDRV